MPVLPTPAGESVPPARIRHGVRRAHDASQCRDTDRLLVDFVVHVAHELLGCVDDRRYAHGTMLRNLPFVVGAALQKIEIHVGHSPLLRPAPWARGRDALQDRHQASEGSVRTI